MLLKIQCEFWKDYEAQHILLLMTEEIRRIWDEKKGVFAAVITDL